MSARLVASELARSGVPAALPRRLAAFLYDALLTAAVLMAFTFVVVGVRGMQPVAPGSWWFAASLLAVHALFFCAFWAAAGQTLGMRAWRLKVERRGGGRIGWARAAARYGAAWLSLAPAGLGFWWSFLDAERRCWHDILTGTRVVRV